MQKNQNSPFLIEDLIKPSNKKPLSPTETKSTSSTIIKPVPVNPQPTPSSPSNSLLNVYLNSFLSQQQQQQQQQQMTAPPPPPPPQPDVSLTQNLLNSSFLNHQNLMNFNHNDAFSQYANLLQSLNPLLMASSLGNTSNVDVFGQLTNMLMSGANLNGHVSSPSMVTNKPTVSPNDSKSNHHSSKSSKKEHHHHHHHKNTNQHESNTNSNTNGFDSNKASSHKQNDPNTSRLANDQTQPLNRVKIENNSTSNDNNSNLVEIVEAKIKLPLRYG